MTDLTRYSTSELCVAIAATLRAADVLDDTALDMITHWQEQAEAVADTIAVELQSRIGESEAEEQKRACALSAYAARLIALPE